MSHIRREFVKLLYQKRTYFGWVGLFIVPFLMAIPIYFHQGGGARPDAQADAGDFYFSIMAGNGLYVAIGSLVALSLFLLPLLSAVSGSQTVAGEAEKGTLRTALMQPVRRGALLAAKWTVANLYVAIGLVILFVGSLIAGGAFFGLKAPMLLSLNTVGIGHGLLLIALGYLFVLVAMATAVSLALLFSTLTDSGLTAAAAAMVLVIIMLVLGNIPGLEFLRPYLFTNHFQAWQNFLRDPIVWTPIRDAFVNFAVWIAVTTGSAWLIFRRKDILS
jgi:ABC-2 type transport system permease protein